MSKVREDYSDSPLALFFQRHNISYSNWPLFYTSKRSWFNKNEKPDRLLLSEAVKISSFTQIPIDALVAELEELGMEFN